MIGHRLETMKMFKTTNFQNRVTMKLPEHCVVVKRSYEFENDAVADPWMFGPFGQS